MLIQLETQCAKSKPRSVFYSYSHKDEDLRDELDTHLALLKREGFISTWHDRRIPPGGEWDRIINENLNAAEIILLLISPDFLTSRYCKDIEVRRAMERSEKREAIVVPVVLRPCRWTAEPFAKLQALPKNCRPLVEWRDAGFAQVSEELRTMMVDLLYPRLPDEKYDGQHGHWVMKLKPRAGLDNRARAERVVSRLQDLTQDFSIALQATTTTQVADGERAEIGLMLILSGTPHAYTILNAAHAKGQLSSRVEEDIASFCVIHGATVQGLSSPGASPDVSEVQDEVLILRPSKSLNPARLQGLRLPKGPTGELEFIFRRSDTAMTTEETRANYQELTDYFHTSLTVKDGSQWVNLSAYEADRMLPSDLSGTRMGANLLAQDCMLKRITASFMHPDSPIGREYWDAVYSQAEKTFGTSDLPFRCFHKVWIVPKEAIVYESDGDEKGSDDPLVKQIEDLMRLPPGYFGAYTLRNYLGVQCETDLVAAKHAPQLGSTIPGSGDLTDSLFREIVLPRIEREVNEGEHFCDMRRMYSAMILATWLKAGIHRTSNERLRHLVDCGNAMTSPKFVVGDFVPGKPSKAFSLQDASPRIDESTAFDTPENREYYAQYLRLFTKGLFRCARNELTSSRERISRVYFSGAVDFRGLRNVLTIRSGKSGKVRFAEPAALGWRSPFPPLTFSAAEQRNTPPELRRPKGPAL